MPATEVAGIFVMGFVRGESRDQATLFPVSLDELIPAEHCCRVIEAFVNWLDLSAGGFVKASPKGTGRPPYDPADLLKLYLYGYLHRVRSSRRLESESLRNIEVMWLLNRLAPDHKTIAEFRRQNGKALRGAGAAFVRFCRGAGLVKGDWIAIDGSKFQAVASTKSVLQRERLLKEQQKLEQQMAEYLAALDVADTQDGEPALDPQAVRAALALLQQERAAVESVIGLMDALGERQVTLSEPDARQMKACGPSYNVQTAVDAEHGIIVSHAVTNEATDNRMLQSMAESAASALAQETLNIVADAGYSNGEQAAVLEQKGILAHVPANRSVNSQGDGNLFDRRLFVYNGDSDTLTCPAGNVLTRKQVMKRKKNILYSARESDCCNCPLKSRCTTKRVRLVTRHWHEEALQRMHERATPALMRLRRCTVEYPFGLLKYQILEKPRLLLRGLWGAGTEMALATLAYNLKRAMAVLGNREIMARLAPA